MRVLVIGGTGPTGPFIVDGLIRRGHQVTVFHRGAHEVEFSAPVEHLHGDPHFSETIEQTLGTRTFDVIVGTYGRLRLVAHEAKGRAPRFIAVGAGAYRAFQHPPRGPVGIPIPVSEEEPFNFDPELDKFSYLIAISEQEVMKIHGEGHYNATIFRYPRIYGPRQPGPSDWSIVRRILDGRKRLIIPDGGMVIQDTGYAENLAHAVLLAVDKPEESRGEIYNVRDEKSITLRERIELISHEMNHEFEFISMPAEVAEPSRPYASRLFHAVTDISKIKKELGYADVVPVEEGIRRTVKWLLDHPPEPGGHIEQNLRDPFDYEAEDGIIAAFREATARIREIPFSLLPAYHNMPHPKKPGQMKDHRDR